MIATCSIGMGWRDSGAKLVVAAVGLGRGAAPSPGGSTSRAVVKLACERSRSSAMPALPNATITAVVVVRLKNARRSKPASGNSVCIAALAASGGALCPSSSASESATLDAVGDKRRNTRLIISPQPRANTNKIAYTRGARAAGSLGNMRIAQYPCSNTRSEKVGKPHTKPAVVHDWRR